jgi:hypothetical protein
LILFAIPAGLAAGALGWLAAGGASASAAKLELARESIVGVHQPKSQPFRGSSPDITELNSLPLLLLTTGPGAVPQPTLRLYGLVRSRTRKAALLSINDKPAEWLMIGETRDGVILQDVLNARIVANTPYGAQEVGLDDSPPAAPPVAVTLGPQPAADSGARLDRIPPGFRAPPPPASAPRPHG